jgi:hypothetical protein
MTREGETMTDKKKTKEKSTNEATGLRDGLERPFPSQAGSFTGYEVQIKRDNGEWGPINLRKTRIEEMGVPLPACHGGILDTLGLLGYAQAKAMAWYIKAVGDAEIKQVEVRIVPFDISYDTKAYKRENDAKAL